MQERYFKIGEVAEILGLEQYTLRYLENTLKLIIKRNDRGDRLYTESDLETFRLILQLKDKGLNTTAIKLALENAREEEGEGKQGLAPLGNGPAPVELLEVAAAAHRIVEQNEELLEQNRRLQERMDRLEKKVEQRNLEREKKIDEFLQLWKAEQDGKGRSWLSRLRK